MLSTWAGFVAFVLLMLALDPLLVVLGILAAGVVALWLHCPGASPSAKEDVGAA